MCVCWCAARVALTAGRDKWRGCLSPYAQGCNRTPMRAITRRKPSSKWSPRLSHDAELLRLLETDLRCLSKVILASNVKIADSSNIVPSRVNAGQGIFTVRDLDTTMVLVLPAFNFIPHRFRDGHTCT